MSSFVGIMVDGRSFDEEGSIAKSQRNFQGWGSLKFRIRLWKALPQFEFDNTMDQAYQVCR